MYNAEYEIVFDELKKWSDSIRLTEFINWNEIRAVYFDMYKPVVEKNGGIEKELQPLLKEMKSVIRTHFANNEGYKEKQLKLKELLK